MKNIWLKSILLRVYLLLFAVTLFSISIFAQNTTSTSIPQDNNEITFHVGKKHESLSKKHECPGKSPITDLSKKMLKGPVRSVVTKTILKEVSNFKPYMELIHTETSHYDTSGILTESIDTDKNAYVLDQKRLFNANGKILSESFSHKPDYYGEKRKYKYDTAGSLTVICDGYWRKDGHRAALRAKIFFHNEMQFDKDGHILVENVEGSKIISRYEYDTNGYLIKLTSQYTPRTRQAVTRYTYDDECRLSVVDSIYGKEVFKKTYHYGTGDEITSIDLFEGPSMARVFDSKAGETEMTQIPARTTTTTYLYSYDDHKNWTEQIVSQKGQIIADYKRIILYY